MRKIEVSAKTVELAIEKGLQMVARQLDEVEVNIINQGSMLKKAMVEIITFASVEEKEEYKNSKTPKKDVELVKKETQENVDKELTSDDLDVLSYSKTFLEGLMSELQIVGEIKEIQSDGELILSITGGECHKLIGFHGEELDAIQYIINTIIKNKFINYGNKIYIDVENYRRRKKESMQELADKMAKKVLLNKKSIRLEPMNAFERKVIHARLQNIDHISTHSDGVEPHRMVVIDYIA